MIGCEQTAATESTVFATNVSGRVKTPDRIPRHSSVPYRSLSLFLSLLFFFILCLRFRYHRDSFRHLKFLLLDAFAYNSDPVRFPPSNFSFSSLHVATYFSRTCDFRFCYRTRRSTISVCFFFIFHFFFIFFRPFFSFAHFRLWFCNFLSLVSVLFSQSSLISFLSIPRRLQSHLSIRHESTLLSRSLFLLFFSLICLFRIFRIRFSARAFYISRSFSRIIPVFLKPLPLLHFIPLFLSATFFNSSLSLFLTASPSSIYFDRS